MAMYPPTDSKTQTICDDAGPVFRPAGLTGAVRHLLGSLYLAGGSGLPSTGLCRARRWRCFTLCLQPDLGAFLQALAIQHGVMGHAHEARVVDAGQLGFR